MVRQKGDPVQKVFKHVFLLSLIITLLLLIIATFLNWSIVQVLGGFWTGVTVNLISFRLIIMSADKMMGTDASTSHGMNIPKSSGFLGRFILYAICLFLVVQFGERIAIIGFAVGISMVALVLKLGAFIPKK